MPTQRFNHDADEGLNFCEWHELWHKQDICPRCYDEEKGDAIRDRMKDDRL